MTATSASDTSTSSPSDSGSALSDVSARHRFDEDALARYLADKAGISGPVSVRQYQGGQSNPTFLLETGTGRLVLRKKPPGNLLPSAHQIEREYRVIAALHGSSVPVPRPVLLCEDPEVIGTAFFVMEHVEGRVITDTSLPDATPEDRATIFDGMNEALAALHLVDWQAAGLGDFGKPERYVARQIERWTKQYRSSRAENPDPAMEELIPWLAANLPEEEPARIAHGDFRLGNLIIARDGGSGRPRVAAVLDWELSTLGDPLGDVAYCCLPWHLPAGIPGASGLAGLDLPRLGIPSEAEFVARYAERTGRDGIPGWNFYLAFSLFRLAAILFGVEARARQGNASSANALEVAGRATHLSRLAQDIIQR